MAKDKDNGVQLGVRPTSQVDLERRLKAESDNDEKPAEQSDQFAVEGNDTSGYVGVSEDYRTYANETEKPYPFEGVEAEAVKKQVESKGGGESSEKSVEEKPVEEKPAEPKKTASVKSE